MTTLIQAIQVHNYGNSDQLTFEQIPQPEPKEGEVLVRVHAAGVNPMDWKIRSGVSQTLRPQSFPYVPGVDFAGVIESVGAGVQRFTSDKRYLAVHGAHTHNMLLLLYIIRH